MSEPVPDPGDLLHRLDMATLASCTCLTKTDQVEFHNPMCRYRLLREAAMVIRRFMRVEIEL